ncbi:MAG TPA: hypothetical protein ENG42_02510 [Candidatus Aenigmarchaeota archaeon]|nr:MAG: hypothetical protein DRP03_03230 [Candidatus Aenigmarchaeota archaeon]HDD46321.1 hypothetical protein [Candidatus Aenigmarchaeota archaeon]
MSLESEAKLNLAFWLLFVVVSILTIYGYVIGLFQTDILLGFLVIIVGVGKLTTEHVTERNIRDYRKAMENLNYMTKGIEQTFTFAARNRDKMEYRLFQLDKKRVELDRKIDRIHRELAKKIIEIENKISELKKR